MLKISKFLIFTIIYFILFISKISFAKEETFSNRMPPRANAGGPYTLIKDVQEQVTLSAIDSIDPKGMIISYEWDINKDGKYDYSSEEPMFILTSTYLFTFFQNLNQSPQTNIRIKLRVTNIRNYTDVAFATLTYINPKLTISHETKISIKVVILLVFVAFSIVIWFVWKKTPETG